MTAKPEKASFEGQVRTAFSFLETRCIAPFRNCRMVDDDPRDAYVGCTFENELARISVTYSWFELGAGVHIHFRRDDLPPSSRGIYLEPWLEYSSDGKAKPVVPFFYPASAKFKPVMDGRKLVFGKVGLSGVLGALAAKLDEHYDVVIGAANDEILRYQEWFQGHR